MSADFEHLRAFILASTKLQLSNRHAVSLLRNQVDTLERRLNAISPITNPDLIEVNASSREKMDEIFAMLEDRTDALLSTLEAYVNG